MTLNPNRPSTEPKWQKIWGGSSISETKIKVVDLNFPNPNRKSQHASFEIHKLVLLTLPLWPKNFLDGHFGLVVKWKFFEVKIWKILILTLKRFNMQSDSKKKLFIKKYPIPFLELCWIILFWYFTYRNLSLLLSRFPLNQESANSFDQFEPRTYWVRLLWFLSSPDTMDGKEFGVNFWQSSHFTLWSSVISNMIWYVLELTFA